MITFFNVKVKETNDLMREQLKLIVVPYLIGLGFKGKLPKFRRINNGRYEIVDFQFNRYGRSLAVNLLVAERTEDFFVIPFEKLKILGGQRLGTRQKRIAKNHNMDHWFHFLKGVIFYKPAYKEAAQSIVYVFEREAEAIYQDQIKAIETGVDCIHLGNFKVK